MFASFILEVYIFPVSNQLATKTFIVPDCFMFFIDLKDYAKFFTSLLPRALSNVRSATEPHPES